MKFKLPNSAFKQYSLMVVCTWGLWAAIAAAAYFLVLGPQQAAVAKLGKEFNIINEQYALAQTAQRKETKVHIETILKDQIEKTSRFVVPYDTASGLTVQVSQLASQHNLSEFSTKTRELSSTFGTDSKAKITDAWLELTFACSFSQFAAFLNSLERSQPVVFVESAQISRDAEGPDLPRARVLVSYLVDLPHHKQTASDTTP
ncbi:MAG: hypothetical protein JXB18_01360 [Sedimentisphaerales bacterium]|nr:hypothetical protein [Sedimentisphaerales bacterium]